MNIILIFLPRGLPGFWHYPAQIIDVYIFCSVLENAIGLFKVFHCLHSSFKRLNVILQVCLTEKKNE